jgi:uncharacterized protein
MEIDRELQERYGYPEITEADKRKVLGENQARLFGVEVSFPARGYTCRTPRR